MLCLPDHKAKLLQNKSRYFHNICALGAVFIKVGLLTPDCSQLSNGLVDISHGIINKQLGNPSDIISTEATN